MTLGNLLVVLGFLCTCADPAVTFVTDWGDLEYDDFTEDASDLEYGQDLVTDPMLVKSGNYHDDSAMSDSLQQALSNLWRLKTEDKRSQWSEERSQWSDVLRDDGEDDALSAIFRPAAKRHAYSNWNRYDSCDLTRISTKAFVEFLRTGRICGRRVAHFRFALSGRR